LKPPNDIDVGGREILHAYSINLGLNTVVSHLSGFKVL